MFHWMTLVHIKDLSMGFFLGGTGVGRGGGWVSEGRVVGIVCTEEEGWAVWLATVCSLPNSSSDGCFCPHTLARDSGSVFHLVLPGVWLVVLVIVLLVGLVV